MILTYYLSMVGFLANPVQKYPKVFDKGKYRVSQKNARRLKNLCSLNIIVMILKTFLFISDTSGKVQ